MPNTLIRKIKKKTRSRLGKDMMVTFVSQLTIMALALAVNKILSLMLGVEGYGQYSIIKKSSAVLSFVMLGGMGISLPRFFAIYTAQQKPLQAKSTVYASLLVIGIVSVASLAFCLLSFRWLSPWVVGNHDSSLFVTTLFFAFGTTMGSLLFAYYRGANAFVRFAVSQIAIQLLIAITTLIYGHNLNLVINLWAISTLAYVALSMVLEFKRNNLYKGAKPGWATHIAPELKTLFRYGLPRMAGDFFLFSFAALPLILINRNAGISASSYFATGLTLTATITPFFSFIGMVLLPYVSSSLASNNFNQTDRLVNQLSLVYLLLSAISVLLLWFGMDFFIAVFFNREFLPAAGVSRILALTLLFESFYLLLRNPIDAVSDFPNNTLNLLLSLVLMVILFHYSETLHQYALSFLAATALKGTISFITWQFYRKRLKK